VVFWIWRTEFYEKRATILYHSTSGDDHVPVPMQGEHADATAMLGARLAAAHDAGKVVLLDVVEDEATAEAERALLDRHDDVTLAADGSSNGEGTAETDARTDPDRTVAEMADALEDRAAGSRPSSTCPARSSSRSTAGPRCDDSPGGPRDGL